MVELGDAVLASWKSQRLTSMNALWDLLGQVDDFVREPGNRKKAKLDELVAELEVMYAMCNHHHDNICGRAMRAQHEQEECGTTIGREQEQV